MIASLKILFRGFFVFVFYYALLMVLLGMGGCARWQCPPTDIQCNLKMEALKNERFTAWVQNNPSQTFHSTYMGYSGYYWH